MRGARVLITGAAGAMGHRYAQRAVQEGAETVVLWDLNAAALSRTVSALGMMSRGRSRIHSFAVDVADLGAIAKTAQRVRNDVGNPDVLINAAAISRYRRSFWDQDNGDDIRPTMKVNALAPLYITREFIPAMIAESARAARIVNIARDSGESGAGASVSAAASAALIAWSLSLRQDLGRAGHDHVKVTTVSRSALAERLSAATRQKIVSRAPDPNGAADRVWHAMLAGKSRVVLP